MLVTKTSMITGIQHTFDLNITEEQLKRFNSGQGYVQDIFPHLTADEREFLLTGVTQEEFDSVFPD